MMVMTMIMAMMMKIMIQIMITVLKVTKITTWLQSAARGSLARLQYIKLRFSFFFGSFCLTFLWLYLFDFSPLCVFKCLVRLQYIKLRFPSLYLFDFSNVSRHFNTSNFGFHLSLKWDLGKSQNLIWGGIKINLRSDTKKSKLRFRWTRNLLTNHTLANITLWIFSFGTGALWLTRV